MTVSSVSTNVKSTQQSGQKQFMKGSDGYIYVFYVDNTDSYLKYKSSLDGVTWGSAANASHAALGYPVANAYFDGTYFWVAYQIGASGWGGSAATIYGRRGSISAGVITWDTQQTIIASIGGYCQGNFCRTTTYVWFAYESESSGGNYRIRVTRTTDGSSWTEKLNSSTMTNGGYHTVPNITSYDFNATDDIMIVTGLYGANNFLYKLWDDSAGTWGADTGFAERTNLNYGSTFMRDLWTENGAIYFVYLYGDLVGSIRLRKWISSWANYTEISADTTCYNPTIANASGTLYIFYRRIVSSVRTIYYRTYTIADASVGGETTFASGETTPDQPSSEKGNSSLSGSIGCIWFNGSSAPYTLRYDQIALMHTDTLGYSIDTLIKTLNQVKNYNIDVILGTATERDYYIDAVFGKIGEELSKDIDTIFVTRTELPYSIDLAISKKDEVVFYDNWHYRKKITLGATVGAGTNYQIGIRVYRASGTDGTEILNDETIGKVYLDGKVRTDFGDVRFRDSTGVTLLDYWMTELNSDVSALFWVEVQADLTASQDIYIYYNNDSATTTSNGPNTFIVFEDFESSSTTGTKLACSYNGLYGRWQNGSIYDITLGNLSNQSGGGRTGVLDTKVLRHTLAQTDYYVAGIAELLYGSGLNEKIAIDFDYYLNLLEVHGNYWAAYAFVTFQLSDGSHKMVRLKDAYLTGFQWRLNGILTAGGTPAVEHDVTSGETTVLTGDSLATWYSKSIKSATYSALNVSKLFVGVGSGIDNNTGYGCAQAYFDNLRIRKYISPSPTFVWGAEEPQGSYLLDVLLKKLDVSLNYATDILLKKMDESETYDLDVVVSRIVSLGYNTDIVLKALGTLTPYELDVVLKKLGTLTPYELDVLLKRSNNIVQYKTDVVSIKKNNTVNLLLDTLFSKENIISPYLIDVVTKTLVTKGYNVDVSFTKKNTTQGYSIDVILLALAQGQYGPTTRTLRSPEPRPFPPKPTEFIEAKVELVCFIKEPICFEIYDRHVLSMTELLLFKKYEDVFSLLEILSLTRTESFMKLGSSLLIPHQTRIQLQSDIAFKNREYLAALQNSIAQKRRESVICFEETIKTLDAIKNQLKRLDDLDSID